MHNRVIYTSIISDYDKLYNPRHIDPYSSYVCITDRPAITNGTIWEPLETEPITADAFRLNRYHKMMPHLYFPDYEESLYIDGRIVIQKDMNELIENAFSHGDIAFRKHPLRNCLYKEANLCIGKRLDNTQKIRAQIKAYRLDKYPRSNGLSAGGIILRRHNEKEIIEIMEDWWSHINRYSRRDQLSLNYILWKKKVRFSNFDGKLLKGIFRIGEHKR